MLNPTPAIRAPFAVVLALLLCTTIGSVSAQPQPDDDGTLFFPPTIRFRAENFKPYIARSENRYYTWAPVLPIVFFDAPGSYAIPERYQRFNSLSEQRDYADTSAIIGGSRNGFLGKYTEVLNIIGYRMRQFPATTIELMGGYSTRPGESPEIARTRAEVVGEYLQNIWEIEPERIEYAEPRMMCDSADHLLRQEEAQRVMILTDSWDLLRPVHYCVLHHNVSTLFLDMVIDPSLAPGTVKQITLLAWRDNETETARVEFGAAPDQNIFTVRGMWIPGVEDAYSDKNFSSVTIQAYIESTDGTLRKSNRLTVQVNDFRNAGDEYDQPVKSLIVPFFGWRDSALTGLQQLLIADFLSRQEHMEDMLIDVRGSVEKAEQKDPDEGLIQAVLARRSAATRTSSLQQIRQGGDKIQLFRTSSTTDSPTYATDTIPIATDARIDDDAVQPINPDRDSARARFFKGLSDARVSAVREYLNQVLPEKELVVDEIFSGSSSFFVSSPNPWPEERWLVRNATIRIVPRSLIFDSERDSVVRDRRSGQ